MPTFLRFPPIDWPAELAAFEAEQAGDDWEGWDDRGRPICKPCRGGGWITGYVCPACKGSGMEASR